MFRDKARCPFPRASGGALSPKRRENPPAVTFPRLVLEVATVRALTSPFLFTASAPDCQDLLKHELTVGSSFRLAFSRPGLVTFKSDHPLSLSEPRRSRLATLEGLSLGGAKTLPELIALLERALGDARCPEGDAEPPPAHAALAAAQTETWTLAVHPWPVAEDEEPTSEERVTEARRAIESAWPLERRRGAFEVGILVPPAHLAHFGYFAFLRPLGASAPAAKVIPPSEAPSRAYSKLVEALEHFQLSLTPGSSALELGAAPGGATFALLERGISVIAVDPAEMGPTLASYARSRGLLLQHIKKPAQAIDGKDLPRLSSAPRYLISDMNVAPPVSAQYVLRARSLIKSSLDVAILTLKLNDTAALDALPRGLAALESAFGQPPQTAHLPSHRREIVAVLQRRP
jgi:23S rRNA (cytidine2498-2'-O)-methyltransferase